MRLEGLDVAVEHPGGLEDAVAAGHRQIRHSDLRGARVHPVVRHRRGRDAFGGVDRDAFGGIGQDAFGEAGGDAFGEIVDEVQDRAGHGGSSGRGQATPTRSAPRRCSPGRAQTSSPACPRGSSRPAVALAH
ncbi:hypothetical protein SDC9_95220 [bioreactor metagenome]|uniref:Uncharacterized protein n=1 Tax=bioreactor metagenome TaxID=1076179 RepID=A0A645A5N0_9ZZZZ